MNYEYFLYGEWLIWLNTLLLKITINLPCGCDIDQFVNDIDKPLLKVNIIHNQL